MAYIAMVRQVFSFNFPLPLRNQTANQNQNQKKDEPQLEVIKAKFHQEQLRVSTMGTGLWATQKLVNMILYFHSLTRQCHQSDLLHQVAACWVRPQISSVLINTPFTRGSIHEICWQQF